MEKKPTPYSNIKIFAHPDKLLAIKQGKRTAPLYVRLKPTNACNHRCYYCSYADDELGLRDDVNQKDFIPWAKMQEITDDFSAMGVKAVTLSGGGEPLVYPYILQTINSLLEKKIDISIITNGQLLNGEAADLLTKAKWVRVSLDSASRATYAMTRRIPLDCFEKVCHNINHFAGIKPKACELGINFVVNHENAGEVYDAAKMVYGLGADHIKFTARVTKDLNEYHQPFKARVIDQIHKAERELTHGRFKVINKYEGDFESCLEFHRPYSRCMIKELVTAIAADSKVYFCHDKAYVKSGVVADLRNRSFKEAWFSTEVQERYKNFDASTECNHHCVYDDRNILLNSFFTLDNNHINFI